MPLTDVSVRSSSVQPAAHNSAKIPPAPSSTRVPGLLEVAPLVLDPRCPLSPPERLILLALASHGGPNSHGIFPSHETLAARAGLSVRSVGTHLRGLLALGVLLIFHRPLQSNLYQLLLERLRALLDAQPAANKGRNRSARRATSAPHPLPTASQPTTPECPSGELACEPHEEQASESKPPQEQASHPPGEQTVWVHGLTEEEVAQGCRFIEEAGRDCELLLGPELLSSTFADAARQPLPAVEVAEPPHDPQPLPTDEQAALADRQEEAAGAATVADKPLHEPVHQPEQGEGASAPVEQDPQMAAPPAEEDSLPEAFEVKTLWEQAWSRRHGGSYTAERSDRERLVFLARTAAEKAAGRQRVLAALEMPAESPGQLAREYLAHCFGTFLGRSGQRTQEGVGFLELKKHPLRCLEQDLPSLGEPWKQATRVSPRGLAKTSEPGLRRATPPPPELAGLVRAIASGQPLPPMRRPGGR